jgi:hypothetical protein
MFGYDWALSRWDPFDMNLGTWRQFENMDRMLDRTFESFENDMELTRQKMLQSQEVKQRAIRPESTSYTKSFHSLDQHEDILDGKRIKYKTLESTKEKDGVKIPHVLREITCDPPVDLDKLRDYIQFKELTGGQEQ